ncbi:MAG: ATP-binding protein, partial [Vicinamibacterales bacterium]
MICLVAGLMSVGVIAPFTAFLGLPAMVPGMTFGFGVVLLVTYWRARQGRHFVRITYAQALVVIAMVWVPAGGTMGSALMYHGAALVYCIVVLRGWDRTVGVAALVCLVLGLIGLEYARPEWMPPGRGPALRLLQIASGVVLGTGLMSLVLGAVVTAYDRERTRLHDSLAALDASQQKLAQSRATLAALVESARDMVWLVEPLSFGLTQYNAAFEAHCRAEDRGAAQPGATPQVLFSLEEAVRWVAHYERALADGPFTTEHLTRGGRTLLVSCGPVRHEGAVLGVSAFAHDITDMRAQEIARAEMERQLLQAQKMEGLGRLAGGVAHDFNNMLAVIQASAEYLKMDEPDPERRDALDAIEQASQRSADLTRKLLAFGRRGKNLIECVSLQDVVRDSLVILTPSMRPDTPVEVDLRGDWPVDGDASQLSQVVLNLCLNARDAMPQGGVLRIATRDVAVAGHGDGQEYVELQVTDTGVGMDDEVKSRIFEPFFSTKPGSAVSGTGLGLATVDGIVHLHGGTISVDSTPGRGSTFTVRLPRGRLVRGAPAPTISRKLTGGTILVVDDEPLIRNVAVTALGRLGYESMVAGDGMEAVAVYSEHRARITGVLLDLRMPRMGGAEAFVAMRALDPDVPVVICTGYGDNEDVQRLVRDGARGLLLKPFRMKEFAEALEKFRAL